MALPNPYGLTPGSEGAFEFEANAKNALADALAEVSGLEPDVPVRPLVAEGVAAEVLLHEARGADLLVVGSRVTAGSRRLCSALSACTACCTRTARSWCSATGARATRRWTEWKARERPHRRAEGP